MSKENQVNLSLFEDENPIGDILFICLGAFTLLFFSAVFSVSATDEISLPEVALSKVAGGSSSPENISSVVLSVSPDGDGQLVVYVNSEQLPVDQLGSNLSKYKGMATVSLRCDETLTVGDRNRIIAICAQAGIERVADRVQLKQ